MEQLIIHSVGDYILQSDWMALTKKNKGLEGFLACFIHCVLYTTMFMFLTISWKALFVIGITHFILDRTKIVPYFIAIKNELIDFLVANKFFDPDNSHSYVEDKVNNFGFHPCRPFAISIWLCIITDNLIHLIINYLAIRYL